MSHPHRLLALLISLSLSLFILLRIFVANERIMEPVIAGFHSSETEIIRKAKPPATAPSHLGASSSTRQQDKDLLENQLDAIQPVDQCITSLDGADPEKVRHIASFLRKHLRQNPDSLDQVAKVLLDSSTPLSIFASLSLITGSLDTQESTRLLLKALEQFQDVSPKAEWTLYALGAWKGNPEWNQRFAFDPDGPQVLCSTEGLRIPLFHRFRNKNNYGPVLRFLENSDPDIRSATVLTLRHSLKQRPILRSFIHSLDRETDPGNQANIAEALAREATLANPETQKEIVDMILEKATQPNAFAIRIKVQTPLMSLPMNDIQKAFLAELAADASGNDAPTRTFALSILAGQSSQSPTPSPSLWDSAVNDPDQTVRAAAVDHLRNHPTPPLPSRLVPILDSDPAWNVRYAAVESLARIPSEDEAHHALNALKNVASNDPHPEVVKRALSILRGE